MSTQDPPAPLIRAPKRWPCELHRLISVEQDDSWEGVLDRLQSHPKDGSFCGPFFGQTALHVACIRYPPLHVIQALLEVAPETAALQNKDGETPLHIACNCSAEDVQLELVRAAPQAVQLADKYGETPLHIAARNGATMRVLEEMLQSGPKDMSTVKNNKGVTPFCLVSRSYVEAESLEDIDEDDDFAGDWEASMVFLRAAAPSPSTPIVHSAALCTACPRPLLIIAMNFYPEHALQYDDMGKLPLHYAAATDVLKEPTAWNEVEDDIRDLPEDFNSVSVNLDRINPGYVHLTDLLQNCPVNHSVLILVLNWNPKAACFADADCRLPLTLALMANKKWQDGLQHLVWAAPRSLETRDPVTHLYPFQLAALYSQDLDTIYNVVRAHPQNLSMGIPSLPPPRPGT